MEKSLERFANHLGEISGNNMIAKGKRRFSSFDHKKRSSLKLLHLKSLIFAGQSYFMVFYS